MDVPFIFECISSSAAVLANYRGHPTGGSQRPSATTGELQLNPALDQPCAGIRSPNPAPKPRVSQLSWDTGHKPPRRALLRPNLILHA